MISSRPQELKAACYIPRRQTDREKTGQLRDQPCSFIFAARLCHATRRPWRCFGLIANMEAPLRSKFMHTITRLMLSLILVTAGSFTLTAQPKPAPKKSAPAHSAASNVNIPIPDIKYTKFVLKNGLTVLVHEDH